MCTAELVDVGCIAEEAGVEENGNPVPALQRNRPRLNSLEILFPWLHVGSTFQLAHAISPGNQELAYQW